MSEEFRFMTVHTAEDIAIDHDRIECSEEYALHRLGTQDPGRGYEVHLFRRGARDPFAKRLADGQVVMA